jgi:hypothetical protein
VLRNAVWILAHEGGWDELLMFGVPIVLAVVAVRWAERRAKRRAPEANGDAAADNAPADRHEDAGH